MLWKQFEDEQDFLCLETVSFSVASITLEYTLDRVRRVHGASLMMRCPVGPMYVNTVQAPGKQLCVQAFQVKLC